MTELLLIVTLVVLTALIVVVAITGAKRLSRRSELDEGEQATSQQTLIEKGFEDSLIPPSDADVEAALPPVDSGVAPPREEIVEVQASLVTAPAEEEISTRRRFRDRLTRARGTLGSALSVMLSRKAIDNATWEELEEALVRCDTGIDLAGVILEDLEKQARSRGIREPKELIELLKCDLVELLQGKDRSLQLTNGALSTWLMVGVNGAGKTTTIAKLARKNIDEGRTVILAAGDTFRAAAAEQLQVWGDRTGAHVVRGQEGADPASVVFDAVESARARNADLLIVDTAGRLHTKVNLMEELKKVRRVIDKAGGNLTETLLVMDATTGQNGLSQARLFAEAVEVSGIVLTKLDGSARGGIVLAVERELEIPVKLVGLGESAADLIEFDPVHFVDALFD